MQICGITPTNEGSAHCFFPHLQIEAVITNMKHTLDKHLEMTNTPLSCAEDKICQSEQ